MRLEQYLTEKWYDSVSKAWDYEIFVNPSKRDLRELDDQYGFRFFIDLKKKKVYITSSEVFHRTVLDDSPKLERELDIDWYAYWNNTDKTNDYIIMGDCNSYMKRFNSDALTDMAWSQAGGDKGLRYIETLKKLLSYDIKWLSKYGFDVKEIKRFLEKTYEDTAKNMGMKVEFGQS